MSLLNKLTSLIPLESLEAEAQKQIFNVLSLDIVEKLAIMPDCHPGYFLPIGGVALVRGAISPNFVGYDQGCGMTLVITDIKADRLSRDDYLEINKKLYERIPVGFNMNERNRPYDLFRSATGDKQLNQKVNDKIFKQLGTLGSGNHFIEIGKNREGFITATIHSGSRNPGHSVAGYYMKLSAAVDKHLPDGFLDINSEPGKCFIHDLSKMIQFALDNRKTMMYNILAILGYSKSRIEEFLRTMVNETHNHAIVQPDGMVLHRKGATESYKGQIGVIPGNMRDGTYIVRGLGNEKYLSSSSHGAGRRGSRRWAKGVDATGKENLPLEEFKKTMRDIIAPVSKDTIEESPSAYKNIEEVISYQEGIVVDVIDKTTPIIVVKSGTPGDE